MTEQQKRAIKIALNFCRDQINIPKRGPLNYEDIAQQIARLDNADSIKSWTKWVIDYEDAEG